MSASWAPVWLATIAATVWGLWWIPIRWLETLGLPGAWAGMAMNAGAVLAALTWMILSQRRIWLNRRAWIGAALVGVAVSAYSIALTETGVVRAVLLFYLAPVWSKLIEWRFFRMPWRLTTTLALMAALLGAYLVLGADLGGAALTRGDLLAVLSGLSWAAGAALIFSGGATGAVALTFVAGCFAVLMALPFALALGAPGAGAGPAGLGMAAGVGFVLPIMVLTLWSAQRLGATVVTFLLTAEIISGVVSGAIWAGEPFGWMQGLGAVLIVLAALSEVLAGRRAALAGSDR